MADLAVRQWGVIDLDDLRGCGLSEDAVATRTGNGTLLRLYRGVLSHFSAVVHWRMRPWIEHLPHVTSPGLRRREGITHHRSGCMDSTVHRGIPVVTPQGARHGRADQVRERGRGSAAGRGGLVEQVLDVAQSHTAPVG